MPNYYIQMVYSQQTKYSTVHSADYTVLYLQHYFSGTIK